MKTTEIGSYIDTDRMTEIDYLSCSGRGDCGNITIYKNPENNKHYIALNDGADTEYYELDDADSLVASDYVVEMILDNQEDADKQADTANWIGVDALNIANDDYTGYCAIIKKTHYYNDEGRYYAVRSNDADIDIFESADEARNKIDEIVDRECEPYYCLDHNESDAPDYYIVIV